MQRKLFFFMILLAVGSVLLQPSAARAMTLRINAPKIELDLPPGGVNSGEISVENPTDQEVFIKAYLEDWEYNPGGIGDKRFSPPGSTRLSASPWIVFSPSESAVPPFGRMTVRYTVTVPKEASGAYYSVLFFETGLGSSKTEEGADVLVAGRIGSLFLIEVEGTVQRLGEFPAIELKPPQGNQPLQIVTTFKNTGNVGVALGGKFILTDSSDRVMGRGNLNTVYTFPGSAESSTTQWVGRLPKGTYQALMTYDLGKGKTLVQEKSFVVE